MDFSNTSKTRRSAAVKIMLHPSTAEKLREVAEHWGQTPATLASIAVSQYVSQQHASLGASERALDGFFESLAPSAREMLQKLVEGQK